MGPRGYGRSLFQRSGKVDKVLSRMSQFRTYLSSNERVIRRRKRVRLTVANRVSSTKLSTEARWT
jgi:hypothetical protein